MLAPDVLTPRLILRAHVASDFDDAAAMWGDAATTRFIGGRPSTQEEVWARILRYAGHWSLLGWGYWAIRERDTNRFVGEVGFADFRRDMQPSFGSSPEIGWVLSPAAHGKGYATEAARAAIAWLQDELQPARTVCMIAPENAPSLRVAAKCGYVEFARAAYKGETSILFERRPT